MSVLLREWRQLVTSPQQSYCIMFTAYFSIHTSAGNSKLTLDFPGSHQGNTLSPWTPLHREYSLSSSTPESTLAKAFLAPARVAVVLSCTAAHKRLTASTSGLETRAMQERRYCPPWRCSEALGPTRQNCAFHRAQCWHVTCIVCSVSASYDVRRQPPPPLRNSFWSVSFIHNRSTCLLSKV
jgi:hypothetical protein